MSTTTRHEECWQLLPWLANGRVSGSERAQVEEHLRGCEACAHELSVQRLLCQALNVPERVSYAPGPSFRKLLESIDAAPLRTAADPAPAARPRAYPGRWALAASVLLVITAAGAWFTAARWSQPRYTTYTSAAPARADVLHIALTPSLSIAEASALLHGAGARIVEGPDASGIFGVAPQEASAAARGSASPQMRALAARLHTDARVRWIEPLAGATTEAAPQPRPPQP